MNTRPKRNANQLYKKLLDLADSDDESEDEEDKTFEGPNGKYFICCGKNYKNTAKELF